MKSVSGQIHIAWLRGHIQPGQNALNLVSKFGWNPAVSSLIQGGKSSMPEIKNHAFCVTYNHSGVKHLQVRLTCQTKRVDRKESGRFLASRFEGYCFAVAA